MSAHRRSTLALAGTGAALMFTLGAARAPSPAPEVASRTRAGASPVRAGADAHGMRVAPIQLQSAGVMHFAPDGTLFLADPRAATIYAIDVAEALRDTTRTGVRVDDVDGKIAAALGTTRDQLRVIDMVAHPLSQTLYFSLTRGRGDSAVPLVVSVTKVEETVTVLPLENIRHSSAQLADAPGPDAKTSWGQSQRQLSITDLALVDGEVFVAGLSNEEFASTMRRIKYPFADASARAMATTVEIFHTSHNRYETASPIESFLPITLNGRPSLVAGYGCSPIATFNRADLATQKHLRGKTIAELGGGNRPFDMIAYRNAAGQQYILIGNSDRTLTRLDPTAVAGAPALNTPVKGAYEAMGVNYLAVASFGVVQLDDYNAGSVVVLQRNRDDGTLQVASLTKRML
ncbi:MAG: hypothetical protein H7066_00750 [Cytophagaceae bacterium]|nr:hypothetical protein [Gemmatimonadaceae bacterium]